MSEPTWETAAREWERTAMQWKESAEEWERNTKALQEMLAGHKERIAHEVELRHKFSHALSEACQFLSDYAQSEADSMAWLTGMYDGSVPTNTSGSVDEWREYFISLAELEDEDGT